MKEKYVFQLQFQNENLNNKNQRHSFSMDFKIMNNLYLLKVTYKATSDILQSILIALGSHSKGVTTE